MTKHCKGVIDEMITDVLKMTEMVTKGELLFAVTNVTGYKTKFKFDNVNVDSLLNATTSAPCRRTWRIPRTIRTTITLTILMKKSTGLTWRTWKA